MAGPGHSCLETRPMSMREDTAGGEGWTLTFTCSCGDALPGDSAGLLSPTSKSGVGVAPLQGLAGRGLGLSLVLGCTISPEEDREESAERLAEFPGVPGASGAWTAGSEELLGTAGGSRSSARAAWPEL